MGYIHPVVEALTLLLALYVLLLGLNRFSANHLGRKGSFAWKRHVNLGMLALLLMLAGVGSGMLSTALLWGGFLVTGLHWQVGLAMVPFLVLSFLTGWTMHRNKKKRTGLPLVHGLLGVICVAMAVVQAITGMKMLV
ncbi:MAG: DUF4079 family protein [Desulfovibrio sp.]|nr:MAG: DUF4079 family protein [Desulfovibrio sp.]